MGGSVLDWRVYGRGPSLDTFWDEEGNLGRAAASADDIAAAQARLGIELPPWLRSLYARYDGGAVRMARAASLHSEDWIDADWLVPRARLLPLAQWFSLAQLRQREDYRDDAFAALAADDSRLIAIAVGEDNGTLCLDYSAGGEPRIVLTDQRQRLREYPDHAAFLAELVEIQYWNPALQARHDPRQRLRCDPRPPSLDTFWRGPGYWAEAAAPADEAALAAAEARLGLRLPALLRALYLRQDGGSTAFEWAPLRRQPSRHLYDWESVVPDGTVLALADLRTLADWAGDFQGRDALYGFVRNYAGCERLLILASHNIEWLLCLDYRERGPQQEPEVVYFEYFGELVANYRARDFHRFFADLRRGELE
ncbi:SMI1/KNR4 family protein [Lysobacter enzymogenes]|uniref:SMI1/KNR4 family protein n=1 Tax=Lysobacter enzymogenes TaxID=69 RepID=UPI00374A667D